MQGKEHIPRNSVTCSQIIQLQVQNSVSTVTRLWAEWLVFDSWHSYTLLSTTSRLALGHTLLPIQWVPGSFLGNTAYHSPPSAEVIMQEGVSTLPWICMVQCLINFQGPSQIQIEYCTELWCTSIKFFIKQNIICKLAKIIITSKISSQWKWQLPGI